MHSAMMYYSTGAKRAAESAGAYWLIGEIASRNQANERLRSEWLQIWKLTHDDNSNCASQARTLPCLWVASLYSV
jgi:hypothetical protein